MTNNDELLEAIRKLSKATGNAVERIEQRLDRIESLAQQIPDNLCYAEEYCKKPREKRKT